MDAPSPRRRRERWVIAFVGALLACRRPVAVLSLVSASASLGLCAVVYWATDVRPGKPLEWIVAYGLPALAPLLITPIVLGHVIRLTSTLRQRSTQLEEEVRRRRRAEARLAVLVTTDELTQVPNRRAFFARAAEIANGTGRAATVAVLDLDNFKRLNDTRGHAAGDDALRQTGALMRERVEPAGLVARLGGEEFGIILPGLDPEEAFPMLDGLRVSLTAVRAELTVSIGAADWHPGEPIDTALGRADSALYRAKQRGRNRVEIASTDDGPGFGTDLAPVARR